MNPTPTDWQNESVFPYDAVVMLTWSCWKSEPRSNRYHYARRFSEISPTLFVQPDGKTSGYSLESTQFPNLQIAHVPPGYGNETWEAMGAMLSKLKVRKPLYWVYNPLFTPFLNGAFTPTIIYHATEDMLNDEFFNSMEIPDENPNVRSIRSHLKGLLSIVDGVVAVSLGVLESLKEKSGFRGRSIVLRNGVDYDFWKSAEPVDNSESTPSRPVVIYQGGVNWRLDFDLFHDVASKVPEADFEILGGVDDPPPAGYGRLAALKNVKFLGRCEIEAVKERCDVAHVGIIPFRQIDLITRRSLPLKAFEYVAVGLPVVSVPIDELACFGDAFAFAADADSFAAEIRKALGTPASGEDRRRRSHIAMQMDYSARFAELRDWLEGLSERNGLELADRKKRRILILYDGGSIHVQTILEHLEAFAELSRHSVFFLNGTGSNVDTSQPIPFFKDFDVVVIHYSIRISLDWHLSPHIAESLRRCAAFKIAFVQDEYDTTETARAWLEDLGIHAVYTCVPEEFVDHVYPPDRFKEVAFIQNLTGYVSEDFKRSSAPPLASRPFDIVYRGRELPVWYGRLGDEKLEIGRIIRRECEARNIACDIEWDDSRRIYGSDWIKFLSSGRATLGSESGSNVFDFDGTIKSGIESELALNPQATREELYGKYVASHEGKVRMNQVSPKIFEAISCRTALILFEGTYSGVVRPDKHFIPVKKDLSNLDEVFEKLGDISFLEAMTQRAFDDVILSGEHSYQRFVEGFDRFVEQNTRRRWGAPRPFRVAPTPKNPGLALIADGVVHPQSDFNEEEDVVKVAGLSRMKRYAVAVSRVWRDQGSYYTCRLIMRKLAERIR